MGTLKSIIRKIQAFMDSARGKTILNYIYSWGAAVVILGTLFKLTHIAGANLMLFVGMGAEVIVFFFSAFERPYEVAEEEKREEAAAAGVTTIIGGTPLQGGTIVINGNIGEQPAATGNEAPAAAVAATPVSTAAGYAPTATITGNPNLIPQMDEVTEEYIEKVRTLNEAIQHISQQASTLGQNMAEMETLARNLTGINALYEAQLRSAGKQANAIDDVNEQTRKMAEQIEELNAMYARMIQAMTTNMNKPQI